MVAAPAAFGAAVEAEPCVGCCDTVWEEGCCDEAEAVCVFWLSCDPVPFVAAVGETPFVWNDTDAIVCEEEGAREM